MTKTKQNKTKRLRRKKQQAQQKAESKGAALSVSMDENAESGKAKVRNRRGRSKGSQVTRKVKRTDTVKERLHESYHEKADQVVSVRGHAMEKGDIFKIIGLGVFFALMVVIVIALWPMLKTLGEPDGLTKVIADVKNAGPLGVLILLGLQFVQIVVAFIPGEVVQVAAGMMYGPWWGALIIFLGCVISSTFIFEVVHRLGAPFVQSMVPIKYMDKFRNFEKTGKLNFIVFLLFFIPGLPKDVFTYLVPLTDMPMRTFILLSCVARIPGIFVSTYAADSLIEGDIASSVIIFAVVGAIALAAILCRNKLMSMMEHLNKKSSAKDTKEESETASLSEETLQSSVRKTTSEDVAKDACEKISEPGGTEMGEPVSDKGSGSAKPSSLHQRTTKSHG